MASFCTVSSVFLRYVRLTQWKDGTSTVLLASTKLLPFIETTFRICYLSDPITIPPIQEPSLFPRCKTTDTVSQEEVSYTSPNCKSSFQYKTHLCFKQHILILNRCLLQSLPSVFRLDSNSVYDVSMGWALAGLMSLWGLRDSSKVTFYWLMSLNYLSIAYSSLTSLLSSYVDTSPTVVGIPNSQIKLLLSAFVRLQAFQRLSQWAVSSAILLFSSRTQSHDNSILRSRDSCALMIQTPFSFSLDVQNSSSQPCLVQYSIYCLILSTSLSSKGFKDTEVLATMGFGGHELIETEGRDFQDQSLMFQVADFRFNKVLDGMKWAVICCVPSQI